MAFGAQAATSAAPASADYCFMPAEHYWRCNYAGESVPKWTKRWFQAATTKRNWYWNEVADNYGGTVYKCAGVKRASNGNTADLVCGWGVLGGFIGSNWRPGWVYIYQGASGPRIIYGGAEHPQICC